MTNIEQSFTATDDEAVSPTLLQNKISLEKEKNQDLLNRRLSRRPSKVDLKLRNILRGRLHRNKHQGWNQCTQTITFAIINQIVDSDDSLHQSGANLEKSIDIQKRANDLRPILKKRPEKNELEEKNIIKASGIDPSLAETQERLRRAQLENTLDGMLRNRPGIDELAEKKIILHFNETVEVLPTFRKSEYNRKPDGNATFRKLTPQMKIQIREELNNFKKNEMSVHELCMYPISFSGHVRLSK
jgi:hypothetical protein